MANKRVLLICGHGNGDSGALGNGFKEYLLNREVGKMLKPLLEEYGFIVDIYNTGRNAYVDVQKGVFNIRKDYDYVFEIHFNAFNKKARGTEIFVTTMEKNTSVEKEIMKNMKKFFTLRDSDGVKVTNFLVIKTVKNRGMSSALIEICFIDNKEDMAIFVAKEKEIVQAIADGIGKGFGMTKKNDQAAIDKAKKEAEEKARKEAEEKARKEAEAKAKKEAEAKKKAEELRKKKNEVAYKVYLGRYGNGTARKNKLKKEGWDFEEIQALVQKIKANGGKRLK